MHHNDTNLTQGVIYMSNIENSFLPSLNNSASKSDEGHTSLVSGAENINIIYKSEIMKDLMNMVERVAPSNATALILGESGTGKELVAHAIHEKSPRREKPFVAINCGALRESLLESELFGHERGAFTGAYSRKIGLAEVANGGTLFLDEIGELSSGIQSKLLRFLQEGEIFRVGGKEAIKVNIRLISATNRKLNEEVENGNFREDLFYRINTIILESPALRRRKGDIPGLINYFLKSNQCLWKTALDSSLCMSDESMECMLKYDWPGNVRELKNICERLQILSDGHQLMVEDLPDYIKDPTTKVGAEEYYDPTVTLHEVERRQIIKALMYFEGNKIQTAKALGITVKTLYNKLHAYGEFEKYAIHRTPLSSKKTRRGSENNVDLSASSTQALGEKISES